MVPEASNGEGGFHRHFETINFDFGLKNITIEEPRTDQRRSRRCTNNDVFQIKPDRKMSRLANRGRKNGG